MSSEEGEMAANFRRRGCPRSPAAAPLDDDDLLSEILLRLPPQPSSLPRASLVCRRCRSLVSDRGFVRRFRLHHRRNPPLLGLFHRGINGLSFVPTLEAPNRILPARFFSLEPGTHFRPLGCRHGLALFLLPMRLQVLVWDPVTGDEHRIPVPPGFSPSVPINGAVVRAAGDVNFRVVLVGFNSQGEQALARVYSSQTRVWSNFISTPLPSGANDSLLNTSAVLVGDSLYWLMLAGSLSTLEFDLDRQSLTVASAPLDSFPEMLDKVGRCNATVMRAESGEMGFLVHSDFTAQLWKRKTDYDGVNLWVLQKTIKLDMLLGLSKKGRLRMAGFAEENNVVFLRTIHTVFMVELESLQFKVVSKSYLIPPYHPLEIVYTAEIGMGGDNGTELLHNA